MTTKEVTANAGDRKVPAKSWRDVLKIHSAAAAYPRLSKDELAELAADIKARGLQVPIFLFRDEGGKHFLLDGICRLDALEATGIDLVTDGKLDRTLGLRAGNRVRVVADVDPFTLAASLNAHRRHLSGEQKLERLEALIKEHPERSDRQIGKEIGVDKNTAAGARRKMERRGEIHHAPTRIDTKGRSQPASKRRSTSRKSPKATGALPLLKEAVDFTKATGSTGAPMTAAVFAPVREDIAPASSREVARLRARVEELENQKCLLESKVIGLESEIEELKAAPATRVIRIVDAIDTLVEVTKRRDKPDLYSTLPLRAVFAAKDLDRVIDKLKELNASLAMRREQFRDREAKRRKAAKNVTPTPTPPSDDGLDIPAALIRLSPDEMKEFIRCINKENNDTSYRYDLDGHGGVQMVQLDDNGNIDAASPPEKIDVFELARDYEIDLKKIREHVAKSKSSSTRTIDLEAIPAIPPETAAAPA